MSHLSILVRHPPAAINFLCILCLPSTLLRMVSLSNHFVAIELFLPFVPAVRHPVDFRGQQIISPFCASSWPINSALTCAPGISVNQRQKTSCPTPAQPVFSIISARPCAKIQSYAQLFWEKIQLFPKIFTPVLAST